MEFEGQCRLEGDSFTGWVKFRGGNQPVWVELFREDISLGIALADLDDYGFSLPIPPAAIDYADELKVRVANSDYILPRATGQPCPEDESPGLLGELLVDRGLTLSGWARDSLDDLHPVRLYAHLDNQKIATALACERRWRPDNADMHGFTMALPWNLADGREHEIHVRDGRDRELPGSPIRICLVPQSLASMLEKNPARAETKLILDCLRHLESRMPGAVSADNYKLWQEAWPPPKPAGKIRCAVATPFLPKDKSGNKSLLAGQKGIVAGALEFVLLIQPGETLHPHALALMVSALREGGGAAIYADAEDKAGMPLFKPAWDKLSFLGRDYLGPLLVRAEVAGDLAPNYGAARVKAVLAAEKSGPILHLPQILSCELPVENDVERLEAVAGALSESNARVENENNGVLGLHFPLGSRPRVSVVIPTRDHGQMLKRCVNSLARTCWDDLEIIIADNGTEESEALEFLAGLEQRPSFKVLRLPGNFNFSWLNNAAVRQASGDLLCFLNNDTEITGPDWLAEMAGILLAPNLEAGCVGAKLLWPNNLVQHGGVVLGIHELAGHVGNHWLADDAGYLFRNRLTQRYSAVTAACMLTPRRLFLDLGGFDEHDFAVNFNDVDYCLRLGAIGKKVYWTPHAVLLHHESASRGKDEKPAAKARAQKEMRNLRKKWGWQEDRFYNPNLPLSTVSEPFEGLAIPPRARDAR